MRFSTQPFEWLVLSIASAAAIIFDDPVDYLAGAVIVIGLFRQMCFVAEADPHISAKIREKHRKRAEELREELGRIDALYPDTEAPEDAQERETPAGNTNAQDSREPGREPPEQPVPMIIRNNGQVE